MWTLTRHPAQSPAICKNGPDRTLTNLRTSRLLLRGLAGARNEIGTAVRGYNLKRMTKLLGVPHMTCKPIPA